MTKDEYLTKVKSNLPLLTSFIRDFHPSSVAPQNSFDLPITAPGPEAACNVVRSQILKKEPQDPSARLAAAVASGDVLTIDSLLNSAWFGVPESTSCWQIPGFKEAVDLMEDPPEMEEEGEVIDV